MSEILIRSAVLDDAAAMLDIYSPFVINTTVTAEYDAPTLEEFQNRIIHYTEKTPWLVCQIDGKIAGYSYASPHRQRAAYQWSVETSIYVDPAFHRRHIATALYQAVFEILKKQGFYSIYVGITCPNPKSIALHKSAGFRDSGVYHDSMYKFGQWRDVIWMSRALRAYDKEPEPVVFWPEMKDSRETREILQKAAIKITR